VGHLNVSTGTLYGLAIDSTLPLSGLVASTGFQGAGAGELVRITRGPIADAIGQPAGELADGSLAVYRTHDSFTLHLRHRGRAELCVDRRTITVDDALADDPDLNHLVATLLLPRYLVLAGELVLHATGIVTDRGVVVVAGDTGAGKSTLATHAASVGLEVISDDAVAVRFIDGVPYTWFGERCSRPRAPIGSQAPRAAHRLPEGGAAPVAIAALVALRERAGEPFVPAGAAAIALVHQHCFHTGAGTIGQNLEAVVRLTRTVPVVTGSLADNLAALSSEWFRLVRSLPSVERSKS
jgi:hypothetical protein